jgi:transcriptional regulator with XRE-family HTH domain
VVVVGKRGPKPRGFTIPRQPFGDMIREDGRTIAGVARRLGFDVSYVVRVAQGKVPPTVEFREALSSFLGQPVDVLFTNEAMRATYVERRDSKGFRS